MSVYLDGLSIAGLVRPDPFGPPNAETSLDTVLVCPVRRRESVVTSRGTEAGIYGLPTDLLKMDPVVGFSKWNMQHHRDLGKEQVPLPRESM